MAQQYYHQRSDRNISMSIPTSARLIFGDSGGATDNVTADWSKDQRTVEVCFNEAASSTDEVYFLRVDYNTPLASSGVSSSAYNFKVNAVIVRDWITLAPGQKLVAISTKGAGANIRVSESVHR